MSSFGGVFHLTGKPVTDEEINGQLSALHHWDADATGRWKSGAVGLSHLMLHNTPESLKESQPFIDKKRDFAFVGDTRLDNRDELAVHFGLSPDAPDSEIILSAYEKWDVDTADHLHGDFAFSIWDGRKQRFYCARDAFGQRPLFYFFNGKIFLFGSEAKAVFSVAGAPQKELDPVFLGLYLLTIYNEKEHSLFRDIWRLPAAHWMTVDKGGIRKHRYWQLDPSRKVRLRNDAEYFETFRELFQKTVDSHARSAFPVASMLSGGLDSSAVAAFVHKSDNRPESFSTLSWALEKDSNWPVPDERKYIDSFREFHPDLDHQYQILDDTPFYGCDDRDIRVLNDGINPEGRTPILRKSFQHLESLGARTLLFGDFGDFSASYSAPDYFWSLALKGRWGEMYRQMKAERKNYGRGWRWLVQRDLLGPLTRVPGKISFLRGDLYQRGKLDTDATRARYEFLKNSGTLERARELMPSYPWTWKDPALANQFWPLEHGNWQNFADYRFRFSTLHKIECRMPFLDRRLVEFCAGIPTRIHRSGGDKRRLIREASKGFLPEKIRLRPGKQPTLPNLDLKFPKAKSYVFEKLDQWETNSSIHEVLDVSGMRSDYESYLGSIEKGVLFRKDHPSRSRFYPAMLVGGVLEDHPVSY